MTTLGVNLETKSIVNSVININRRGTWAVQRNESCSTTTWGFTRSPGEKRVYRSKVRSQCRGGVSRSCCRAQSEDTGPTGAPARCPGEDGVQDGLKCWINMNQEEAGIPDRGRSERALRLKGRNCVCRERAENKSRLRKCGYCLFSETQCFWRRRARHSARGWV